MKVAKVMHKGLTTVDISAKLSEVAKLMRDKDIGALPVREEGYPVGMITDRDIVCRGLANGKPASKLTARDVMTEHLSSCKDTDDVREAMRLMRVNGIRRLAVVNAKGKLVGMLGLGDLSAAVKSRQAGKVLRSIATHHS